MMHQVLCAEKGSLVVKVYRAAEVGPVLEGAEFLVRYLMYSFVELSHAPCGSNCAFSTAA